MRALSLTPWWAWLVVEGIKPLENRKWVPREYPGGPPFRGDFLIHASRGEPKHRREVADFLEERGLTLVGGLPEEVEQGGFVGIANLVDSVLPRCYREAYATTGADPRWHMREQHGHVLRDVELLPFVPWKGSLGFWKVPSEACEEVCGEIIRDARERELGDGKLSSSFRLIARIEKGFGR